LAATQEGGLAVARLKTQTLRKQQKIKFGMLLCQKVGMADAQKTRLCLPSPKKIPDSQKPTYLFCHKTSMRGAN
jgi:hypothetical protein